MMKRRQDYGSEADAWFDSLADEVNPLAREPRALILKSAPQATERIKWGAPAYEQGGMICGLRAGKGYVALQFGPAAANLDDPDGLLEGTGKKMRHPKVRGKGDIRQKMFAAWIRQAARERS